MAETEKPQTVIFVGGAPRSGTTLLHQVICTSARTNVYCPEITFVLPIVNSYVAGLANWSNHTHAFFAEKEHFRLHIKFLLETSLAHISLVLKDPEVLSVKNPNLTPRFPEIREMLGERARFVTIVRNPYDIVRSLQEVAERSDKVFDEKQARDAARLVVKDYAHLDDPRLAGNVLSFRYEDILKPETTEKLRQFTGLTDIDPSAVGSAAKPQPQTESGNPWFSPKYHNAIDLTPRLPQLDPKYRRIVDRICGPLMDRFGYDRAG